MKVSDEYAIVSIHALERSWELYKAPKTSGVFEGTLQGAKRGAQTIPYVLTRSSETMRRPEG
jgi:hypothetical protein